MRSGGKLSTGCHNKSDFKSNSLNVYGQDTTFAQGIGKAGSKDDDEAQDQASRNFICNTVRIYSKPFCLFTGASDK